jgi:uncharacterized phage protein (TIGR01671 family)
MRELKFRAWNGKKYSDLFTFKTIVPGRNSHLDCIISIPGLLERIDDNSLIFEQYTGLKDSKGVEIYEGDVIKTDRRYYGGHEYQESDGTYLYEVYYMEGAFSPFADLTDNEPYPRAEKCEVIGNVHENPELIKEAQW